MRFKLRYHNRCRVAQPAGKSLSVADYPRSPTSRSGTLNFFWRSQGYDVFSAGAAFHRCHISKSARRFGVCYHKLKGYLLWDIATPAVERVQ